MRSRLAALVWMATVLTAAEAAAQHVEVAGFAANTPPGWSSMSADGTGGRDGSIVLVWDQFQRGSHGPLPREIGIQRFSAAGVALAPAFRMPVSDGVPDAAPRIVADETGGYLMSWTGGRIGTDVTPMAIRLDEFAVPAGVPFQVDVSSRNQSYGRSTAIAALPASEVIAWFDGGPGDGVLVRRFDRFSVPFTSPFQVGGASGDVGMDVVTTPDGGFVVAEGARSSFARSFDAHATPRVDLFTVSEDSAFEGVARSPIGDVLAVVGTRPAGSFLAHEIWVQRFTRDGVMLGPEFMVHDSGPDTPVLPGVAFDVNGNMIVAWSEYTNGGTLFRARGYDANAVAIGPAVTLQTGTAYPLRVHTTPIGGFRFLSTWPGYASSGIAANVVSLCTPGTNVCGDGVIDGLCEICDDGAGNSDVAPDACRTDCRPARCGDGTTDAGETCDDANTDDCDGCSSTCAVEVGLGCGDGIPYPSCGESCDDGNLVDRDGCSATCVPERIPGGGSPASDCYTEWSVTNPPNEPYLDTKGAISATQQCVDDDPRCDFDGGTPGGCTFHLRVCVNNSDLPRCEASRRLQSWRLVTPSAAKAAHDPAAATVRAAVSGAVLASVVGPSTLDLCSPAAEVRVPLRGVAGRYGTRKLKLKTQATLYSGAKDVDAVQLICVPAP